jgi:hypothetical protein
VIYGVQFGAHSTKTIHITSYKLPQKQLMVYFILERMVASLLLEKTYTKSLVYVLLSNIYASTGFEDKVNLNNEKRVGISYLHTSAKNFKICSSRVFR